MPIRNRNLARLPNVVEQLGGNREAGPPVVAARFEERDVVGGGTRTAVCGEDALGRGAGDGVREGAEGPVRGVDDASLFGEMVRGEEC